MYVFCDQNPALSYLPGAYSKSEEQPVLCEDCRSEASLAKCVAKEWSNTEKAPARRQSKSNKPRLWGTSEPSCPLSPTLLFFFVIPGVPTKVSLFSLVAPSSPDSICSGCGHQLHLLSTSPPSHAAHPWLPSSTWVCGENESTYFGNPCIVAFSRRGVRRQREEKGKEAGRLLPKPGKNST